MIELFNGTTTAQTVKHYSTKRTFIPTFELNGSSPEADYCVCAMQCIPCLKFLTDEVGTDTTKNDFFSLYQNSITGGSHKVFIYVEGDEEGVEITNNDYGTLYNGTNWYSYEFTAFKVWQQIGYKEFYTTLVNYDSSGETVNVTTSACRKLIKFSDVSANGTITIESRKNGILRHGNDYSGLTLVSGLQLKHLRNQIRLSGSLEFSAMLTEETHVVLNDSEQSTLQIFEKGSIEYDMHILLASSDQVMPVLLDDLFANSVLVTDYNLFNFEKYTKKKVRRVSAEFNPGRGARRKSFHLKMLYALNDIEKFND